MQYSMTRKLIQRDIQPDFTRCLWSEFMRNIEILREIQTISWVLMTAHSSAQVEHDSADDEIDLSQLFAVIWRGKSWVILSAVFSLAVGAYYASKITPLYTATAAIVQETTQEQVVDFSGALGGLGGGLGGGIGAGSEVNTEIEVMQSRSLLDVLVTELNLTNDPEFNHELQPEAVFSAEAITNLIRSIMGLPIQPNKILNAQEILASTVDNLREVMSVSNIPSSYVYEIMIRSESSSKSALIANALAELYIRNQLETKSEANLSATEWLANRVGQLSIDLENAETAAKEFSANTDLINADTLFALSRQVKELRERLETVRASKVATTAQLMQLRIAASENDPQLMSEAADDPVLRGLLISTSLNTAVSRTTFDARFFQVVGQTEQELRRQEVQIEALEQSIEQQEDAIDKQSDDLVTLQQFQREVVASGLLYEYFLSRLKETSVQSGVQTPESRILSRAVVPQDPSSPNKIIIIALTLFLAVFVSTSVILLREVLRGTFRGVKELEQKTGYTVLGQIPKISMRRSIKLTQHLTNHPLSEAIRNMRTSVLQSGTNNPPQVIMSTCSVPGEGKIEQSFLLAQNLTSLGKKVLLVEGDLRIRNFAEYFDIRTNKGLLAILDGQETIESSVVFHEILQVDVLISEEPKKNAADILSSQSFEQFIADVRELYDYIVIDTPPVLAVTDAHIIGRLVDATIYTVRWNHTTYDQVVEGTKSLKKLQVKVSGLVLSRINLKRQKRLGHGDSVDKYGAYYGK
jgi:capsular exopolysaccharide synthesis family protein